MNAHHQTAAGGTNDGEGAMKPTASKMIRWTGLAAMAAGIIFAIIQPIHPPDIVASVTTGTWATVHTMGVAMCLFGLLGIAGLYARQVEEVGWIGLVGYLLFSLFFALTLAFQFVEALVSPVLATVAPTFVEGFLGIITGAPSQVDLGAIPSVYAVTGVTYLLGGLLFGFATMRAGILPRWAGALVAAGGPLAALMVALLPHAVERFAAVPMGVGLAWLGFALWSERRAGAAAPAAGQGNRPLQRSGTD